MSESQPVAANTRQEPGAGVEEEHGGAGAPVLPANAAPKILGLPFDPLRLAVAVWRGWRMGVLGIVCFATLGFAAGWLRFQTQYRASVQLVRRELPNSFRAGELGEAFKPRQFSMATIASMMRTPKLLSRVGAQSRPPISARELSWGLTIAPERNTELISVSLETSLGADATTQLINRYAQAVIDLTVQLQRDEAGELEKFLAEQLTELEAEHAAATRELDEFTRNTQFLSAQQELDSYLRALNDAELRLQTAELEAQALDFRILAAQTELENQNPLRQSLAEAQDELADLLTRYTDANPLVVQQRARLEALEARLRALGSATNATEQFQAGDNTVANSLYLDLIAFRAQREALLKQLPVLETARSNLSVRLQGIPAKGQEYARIKARQQSLEVTRDLLGARLREARLFSQESPGYYRIFAEATPQQVVVSGRVKKIIVVTLAGAAFGAVLAALLVCCFEVIDDRVLSPGDVRRLTRLPVRAQLPELDSLSQEQLAVWRFRTWSGLRYELGLEPPGPVMLALVSAHAGEGRSTFARLLQGAAAERAWRTVVIHNGAADNPATVPLSDALATPEHLREVLADTRHVELVWDAEDSWDASVRTQWHMAMQSWKRLRDVAFFIELPPANRLESIMLAEAVPCVFWLSAAGSARGPEVKEAMTTLRLAGVKLVGALLNRTPRIFSRLPDLARFGFMIMVGLGLLAPWGAAKAQTTNAMATAGLALSAAAAGPRLAPWQERLTLGPGDQVNLSIYGHKEFSRAAVPVGPDGRLSYLQVQDLPVAGLTIDELREKLNERLAAYHRNARVIVTPAAWRSKKYYLLGTVMDRGTYYLDQPVTIIEAVARARGIATGLLEQNTVEIADLPRTFLVRQGQRLPVDFAKLFEKGDLSQNVQLEPGDYIYFPSATLNEVYVLGSVDSPGTVGVTGKSTVISVITTRGGFTPKAYKQRVLVVRGSLNQPETHVVNVGAILAGKEANFTLLPKDIVYVADRPWARVEELLDMAVRAFVVSATAEWVNANVSPLIVEPILPSP